MTDDDLTRLRDEVAVSDVSRWMARHVDIFEVWPGENRYCLTDADVDRLQADITATLARKIAEARGEAWDAGYRSGHSNAMRRMSDEPDAPATPNPYRATLAEPNGPEGER